ncbi:hypothetical protein D3C83_161820 [compost metagenome]
MRLERSRQHEIGLAEKDALAAAGIGRQVLEAIGEKRERVGGDGRDGGDARRIDQRDQ